MKNNFDNIFENFEENNIFKNKAVLQSKYQPEEIPYRDEQIKQIALILGPTLRGEKPSNLFLYGKTGTGKTISIQKVKDELIKRTNPNSGFSLRLEYLNCKLKKIADTEYRILAELISKLGGEVPATGLPTQAVYDRFVNLIDKERQLIVLILDEVDQTVKKISSDFLYNLTRLNSELSKSQISIECCSARGNCKVCCFCSKRTWRREKGVGFVKSCRRTFRKRWEQKDFIKTY